MAVDALRLLNQTLEKRVAQSTADRNRMWTLSTDVMMVAGLDGTLNSVNPAWTHLLGWQETELIGANVMDFVVPEERAALQAELDALSRGTAPRLIELTMRTGDGGSRRIEWSAVAADNLLQAVGRDVTAEREAEEALRQAEEALRHSQKMEAIGQLTGGIAHDFNNMLTAIIGSMEVLKRRIRDGRYDDVQSFMDSAIGAANRAAALTHRLLAFARRQPLDPKAVDVNQLINGMEDLLERTLGEKIKLAVRPRAGTRSGADRCPSARERDPQPRDQRPRCHAPGRNADHRHRERGHQEPGTIRPGDDRRRRLYRGLRRRHRRRNVAGHALEGVRAVLHDQADRPGDRPRPVDDLWLRQAVARSCPGRKRRECRHDLQAVPAALPGRRRDESRRAGARRRHRRRRDRAGHRGRFGGAPHHLERAARPRLCLPGGERRSGRAAHPDVEHAARPADHRRRACPA